MASSQGTSVSSNSFSRWATHDIFLFKYHFLLHILRFLIIFSDNIMADVASKQQTTALFLSTIVTRTRRHTKLTKKNWQTWWETCAVPENILFSFSCSYLTVQFNSECMGPFTYDKNLLRQYIHVSLTYDNLTYKNTSPSVLHMTLTLIHDNTSIYRMSHSLPNPAFL